MEQRRRVAIPVADAKPLGQQQRKPDGDVPRGNGRQRMPRRGRHQHPKLWQQSLWVLGLHPRG